MRQTTCSLVTVVQTCALPILPRSTPCNPRWKPLALAPSPTSLSTFFGAGSEASSSEISTTPVGISQIAQKPQNSAKRSIAGIGAIAIRKMPTMSVKMRSEENTSELQSLMRISYDVFCLKKKQRKEKREQKQ